MRLVSARVQGFQSFNDSGVINFTDGINLIIGQNNAGKSAFLRALLPSLPDDRHRTPDRWETFRLPSPLVDLAIEASGAELEKWILRAGNGQHIPLPNENDVPGYIEAFFKRPAVTLLVQRTPGASFSPSVYPSHQLFWLSQGSQPFSALVVPTNGELAPPITNASNADSLPGIVWEAWNRDMFYFAAERMTIGEAPGGHATRLTQNASNLPNVLHSLANERGDVFARLIEHLREIFSTVGNLSIRTKPDSSQLEVRVWPTEAMARVDLSFPLNSSGTGVSQVIALLTAIMTLDRAVFIIDEINSFL
ncbi:MAG: AAA family ATPase, partial [Alphaproteobacteria bacterium]|nr:AAA family ATPase [Alphaproteobacteria bacterium]